MEDDVIKDRIKHILDVLLRDNLKAYAMLSDGTYAKMSRRGKQAIGAQMTFCREAMEGSEGGDHSLERQTLYTDLYFDEEEHEA